MPSSLLLRWDLITSPGLGSGQGNGRVITGLGKGSGDGIGVLSNRGFI